MPEPTPEAWAQIRHAYENTDQPIVNICAEHGITDPMLRYRVSRWKWRKRRSLIPREGPPAMRAAPSEVAASAVSCDAPASPGLPEGGSNGPMVPRLQNAVARLMPAIEAAIAQLTSGKLDGYELEKARRALGTLTRTLRELNAVLVQHDAGLDAPEVEDDPVPKDIDEFRYELARRIRGFIEAHQNEQKAQPGQEAGLETQNDVPHAAMDGPAKA
jgi:hypothetical protein